VKYYKLAHVGDVNVDVRMLQVCLLRHGLDDMSKLPWAGLIIIMSRPSCNFFALACSVTLVLPFVPSLLTRFTLLLHFPPSSRLRILHFTSLACCVA
jgi:hypothetical protein